ncbi:hypothetical protein XBP1_2190016 [Xenorhabdus bovienii str. puntauvense]|uniref:Phage protein n=1 Tax=Xenorhabdus bovienii str. puntauvense TaxID=1398201 RepID=A0A077NFS7_XENBV|nr:hypothetical protein [Xenorhabdus bovienii]CDG96670.1 hypothetical protein XBP1_2190016 [Xenorhabdus bovienii str. puntauvense]
MPGFLSKLFGKKNHPNQQMDVQEKTQKQPIYPKTKEDFLIREISISRYVEPEYKEIALKQVNKEIDLFADKDSKEYMKVLTKKAISTFKKPKDAFFAVQRSASVKFNMLDTLNRFESLGLKEFDYDCPNDERDCDWCSSQSGKTFPINTDIVKLIEDNCECEYNRSVLLPKVKW